jgi:hypothetical protein
MAIQNPDRKTELIDPQPGPTSLFVFAGIHTRVVPEQMRSQGWSAILFIAIGRDNDRVLRQQAIIEDQGTHARFPSIPIRVT